MELTGTNRSRAYPIDNSLVKFRIQFSRSKCLDKNVVYSLIAQLVEHSTVNRVVTGSSPVRGAIYGEVSELAEGARLEIV